MRGLRGLAWLAAASLALCACGRSHLGLGGAPSPGEDDPFDLRGGAGAGASADGAAGGATDASGAGPMSPVPPPLMQPPPPTMVPPPVMQPPPPMMVPPPPSSGWGRAGSGGSQPDAGAPAFDPDGRGSDVLNPQRCATREPFVLSIDPGGASGYVRGWLESAPFVLFDEFGLPRFAQQAIPGPEGSGEELGLWWSIASLGEPASLWFYPASGTTVVGLVGARRFSEIGDATALMWATHSIGPVEIGQIAVFHHRPTDRYLAVQVVELYGTEESDRRELCAAVEARWQFGEPGTGSFTRAP